MQAANSARSSSPAPMIDFGPIEEIDLQPSAHGPKPAALSPSQQVHVLTTIAQSNERQEQRLVRRYAENIASGMLERLVRTVAQTPELQQLLDLPLQEEKISNVNELINRMQGLLAYERLPETEDDGFVVMSRGLHPHYQELLDPVYNDLKVYFQSFNIDLEKEDAPAIFTEPLKQQLKEQITSYINGQPSVKKKLKVGLKSTFTVLWTALNVMSTLGVLDTISGPSWIFLKGSFKPFLE